jgi:hypothetical protein
MSVVAGTFAAFALPVAGAALVLRNGLAHPSGRVAAAALVALAAITGTVAGLR